MSIQSEFKKFNEKIRLDYGTNSELAEKRDTLLRILENDKCICQSKTVPYFTRKLVH